MYRILLLCAFMFVVMRNNGSNGDEDSDDPSDSYHLESVNSDLYLVVVRECLAAYLKDNPDKPFKPVRVLNYKGESIFKSRRTHHTLLNFTASPLAGRRAGLYPCSCVIRGYFSKENTFTNCVEVNPLVAALNAPIEEDILNPTFYSFAKKALSLAEDYSKGRVVTRVVQVQRYGRDDVVVHVYFSAAPGPRQYGRYTYCSAQVAVVHGQVQHKPAACNDQ